MVILYLYARWFCCCCVVVVVCVVDIVPQVLRRACTGKAIRLYRKISVHVVERSLAIVLKNIYFSFSAGFYKKDFTKELQNVTSS